LAERISQLDARLEHADFEGIGKLPGYRVLDRESAVYDCATYALPDSRWADEDVEALLERDYLRVSQPETGDIVAYSSKGKNTHFGILVGKDRVRSKFGVGYVYEHPVDVVPTMYGRVSDYYRRRATIPSLS